MRLIKTTRSILALLFSGILLSCQHSKQDKLAGILSNVCFWDVLDADFNMEKTKYTYRLLPGGVCYQYRYNYANNKRQNSVSHFDGSKGEVDIGWAVKNDSVLIIGKENYKVKTVDKDFLFLETSYSNGFILQKNCKTFIKD